MELKSIPLSQIICFGGDPRMAANPELDRIKQSINAIGVEQPFSVAPLPNGKYVVSAGGNTRLRVLQEIHAKTIDETTVQCLIQPFQSEGEMLLAHLRENDIRGQLTFIEKAMAIEEMRKHLDMKEYSQRRLCSDLAHKGYTVAQSNIPLMSYAANRLYPHMPDALEGGMGRPAIKALCLIDNASRELWNHWLLEHAQPYDEVFAALCKRQNRGFVSEVFESDMAYEVSELADCTHQTAALALAEAISGNIMDRPKPEDIYAVSDDAPLPEGHWPSLQGSPTDDTRGTDSPRPATRTVKNPAQNLADRFGLGLCVSADLNSPIGIQVDRPPDDRLSQSLKPEEWTTVQLVWWSLALASHNRVLQAHDGIPIDQLATGLWAALDDRSWKDYLTTLSTYRKATRLVEGKSQ